MPVRFLDPRNKGFFLFGLRFRTVLQEENSPGSASESHKTISEFLITSNRDGMSRCQVLCLSAKGGGEGHSESSKLESCRPSLIVHSPCHETPNRRSAFLSMQ
ncbi:hypothetical protein FNV43_RR08284 [Rhamnella rubrinervis]|uniref:Uncharacterized protein n=1 Tax=Rhamnella rubrinervis TaxID=2594499 RepID=A0A8K0HGT7_9ROSA|nr:hypothetical protein FNV43_RR08284 [Rhamnella rubrinervis]